MPFQKGHKLSQRGRPPGIRDKRLEYYDVHAKLIEHGHDPIVAIIEMAKDALLEPVLRFKANQELLSKVTPTLKSIEKRGDSRILDDIEEIRQNMEMLMSKNISNK